MRALQTLAGAAAIAAVAAAPSASFAGGRGPGPCTHSGNYAVGAEGPAMSGGQLMAGVGNCRQGHSWRNSNAYYEGGPQYRYGYDRPYVQEREYYDNGPGISFGYRGDRW